MTNPLVFHDIAQVVLDCVCEQMDSLTDQLAEQGIKYGCPCLVYVSPGSPAWDNCCDPCNDTVGGQLTVHIVDIFESIAFPDRGNFTHPCAPNSLVMDLAVTVVRCAPTMDSLGHDPAPEDLSDAARIGYADLWAMLVALQCCVTASTAPGRTKRLVSVASMRPVGEPSDCMGFEVRAFVQVGAACGCPEGS